MRQGSKPDHLELSQQGQKLSKHDEQGVVLLHLQHSHQTETLLELCSHNSPIRFGMLVIDQGSNQVIYISHGEHLPDSTHLLA